MATIALHRLTDWPTFRHVRPLLSRLGIGAEALQRWHYYYLKGALDNPFQEIPELGGEPEHEPPLLALCAAYAEQAPHLVGAKTTDKLGLGFHWSASLDELLASAQRAGHTVVLASESLGAEPPTAAHLSDLYSKWEQSAVRAMLKETFEPVDAKRVQRYLDEGGEFPEFTVRAAGSATALEFYFGFGAWTARHERMLDVFVAATDKRACPVWNSAGDRGRAHDDWAGRLRDTLVARGVGERVIFDALCREPEPGSSRVAFGHQDWPSRHALLLSWFADLDRVVAMGSGSAAALFQAQTRFPAGLRALAGIVTQGWCRAGGFARLDVPGLAACAYFDHKGGAAFKTEAARAYTTSVLALPAATMSELIAASYKGVPNHEQQRFDEAVKAAARRDDVTLHEWKTAHGRGLVTDAMFAAGVVPAFQRAVSVEFRTRPHGFGDHEGFVASAPIVGSTDPDLYLAGWVALSTRFNEHGLREHREEWDSLLPKHGFSRAALARAATHFSAPPQRSSAKILGPMLAARGIELTHLPPPPLDEIDHEFQVGTDVAHLIVGGYDAVEAVAGLEDPDDWPGAIRKHRCVGLETGADGQYTVRVIGAAAGADAVTIAQAKTKGATHLASFPFEIQGDALTVSGIVGAGGTPTIAFPSGIYTAEAFTEQGAIVIIIVTKAKKRPKWTFGADLPHL